MDKEQFKRSIRLFGLATVGENLEPEEEERLWEAWVGKKVWPMTVNQVKSFLGNLKAECKSKGIITLKQFHELSKPSK